MPLSNCEKIQILKDAKNIHCEDRKPRLSHFINLLLVSCIIELLFVMILELKIQENWAYKKSFSFPYIPQSIIIIMYIISIVFILWFLKILVNPNICYIFWKNYPEVESILKYLKIFYKFKLKGMWYIGDEQIWLILGLYMFVSKVHKIFISKFGEWQWR